MAFLSAEARRAKVEAVAGGRLAVYRNRYGENQCPHERGA
jgi:hypothetical protein